METSRDEASHSDATRNNSSISVPKTREKPSIIIILLPLLLISIFKAKETSCDFVCRKQDNDQISPSTSNSGDNSFEEFQDSTSSLLFPCRCQSGAGGLQIMCQNTNLAMLSQTLRKIEEPIERLEIADAMIPRLFGPILSAPGQYESLHSGALRELSIRNSQLEFIGAMDSSSSPLMNHGNLQNNDRLTYSNQNINNQNNANAFVFGSLSQSLESLQLAGNKLQVVPSEALYSLTNLRILNLANNQISQLDYQGTNINNNNNSTSTPTSTRGKQLVNLTELDLSRNRVSRLTRNDFLRDLQSLEWLNLCGNELVKLERNCLNLFGRKLRQLDLSSNKLTSLDRLDFSDLQVLEWLSLANNQLATLPRSIFSRNVKLYTLDLSSNKLDDLDTYLFKSVKFLRRLNVSSNAIRELGRNIFAPTNRIKWLDFSENQIQQVGPESFKSLDWLEQLDLSRNQIVNITSEAFSKLATLELNLSFNKLTRIAPSAFHEIVNLTRLNLSHNLLQSDSISAQAFEKVECQQLDLSHNFIDDLSKLPVSNFTRLQSLICSHNFLTELNKKSFSQRQPLLELAHLDISHNDISQISGLILADKLRNLRTLNLSFNSLRRLTANAFGQSTTLHELDLSNNNLVELVQGTLSGLQALKKLNLRQNRLKKMIQIPQALTHLSLQFNEISQITSQHQQQAQIPPTNQQQQQQMQLQLVELNLESNKISQMEQRIAPMPMLKTLSLANNNLSSIPALALQDLISLQRLNLSANAIRNVMSRSFQQANLRSLWELDLSSNNLTFVADFAFDGLAQLSSLSLRDNNLRELAPFAFFNLGLSLRHLNLEANLLSLITPDHPQQVAQLSQQHQQHSTSSSLRGPKPYSSSHASHHSHLNLINQIGYKNNASQSNSLLVGKHATILQQQQQQIRSPFQDLESLEVINLSFNMISQLNWRSFAQLNSLTHLNLGFNRLVKLEAGSLGQLPALQTLVLRNNLISEIEPNLLGNGTQSLRVLDLSFNKLTELRAGCFKSLDAHKTPNLNTILLNNNKLTQLSEHTVRELNSLNPLKNLNLTSNRLQAIQPDFIHWIRRGILVDLRNQEHSQSQPQPQASSHVETTTISSTYNNVIGNGNFNQFECNCDLLPFVSWLDGVKARNLSYWVLGSETTILQQQQSQPSDTINENNNSNVKENKYDASSAHWTNRQYLLWLTGQYAKSASLLSSISCQKPKLMQAKQLSDLSSMATRPDMQCDPQLLQEADAYKRLRAPIQLNGAQFNPPSLKISWSLLDPTIEVSYFVLVRAVFQQEPNLSAIRWNLASTNQFGLIRLTLDRLNYEHRSHSFLEAPSESPIATTPSHSHSRSQSTIESVPATTNSNNHEFNLICILHEPSSLLNSRSINQDNNSSAKQNWSSEDHSSNMDLRLQILAQASRRLNGGASRSVGNVLDLLIADVDHVNCLDLRNLLESRQDNSASLMIEGGSSRLGSGATAAPLRPYALSSILIINLALSVCFITHCKIRLLSGGWSSEPKSD